MAPSPTGSTLVREVPFGSAGDHAAATTTIRQHRLDNGLDVVLLRDPSAPIVAYQTWFRVGSRHETPGKTGLAHLFEHLMFNQTEHLQPGEFDRRLEAVGSDTNAATWLDWTYYRENVPREHLELVMELEADRMANLVVLEPQIESERHVVVSERRLHVEDDVEGFLDEQLWALAYEKHPYRWPTIGWMEDILGIGVDDARAFYRTYYAPNNATLVLVGDLDEAAALERIQRHYGPLRPSPIPVPSPVEEPEQRGERRKVFEKEVQTDRLLVGWRGVGLRDPDHAPLEVAMELLAGGPSSRLYRALVVDEEIASSVDMHAPDLRDPGLIELRAALMRGEPAARAEEAAYRTIEGLATAPPEEELQRAKNRLEAQHWRSLRHPEGKARALGHWQTTIGDFAPLLDAAERLREVTGDDVARVVSRYLAAERRTVVIGTRGGTKRGGAGKGRAAKRGANKVATGSASGIEGARHA